MATTSGSSEVADFAVRYALSSDTGTEREHNEDACGSYEETPTHVLVTVADGVSGEEGGEIASQTAIEVTLRAYKESPASWGPAKRLYRAVQQANIEIHDRALVVTELRRMSTTLTAIVIDNGILHAAHVGDTRLYLIRGGAITQKTKDHTVAAGRQRMGLSRSKGAKHYVERSTLTRSVGRELIVAVDRITFALAGGDVLVVCSDGLYNVLEDDELRDAAAGDDPQANCAALIRVANERGTSDNLTAAVVRVTGSAPRPVGHEGWRGLLARLAGRTFTTGAFAPTLAGMTDLLMETLTAGAGTEAKTGQRVTVHYVGTLTDGKKFDSSRDRNEGFKFTLGRGEVIQGWDRGVAGMRVGELRKLTIPPDMGYGARGFPPVIPANATLVFEVELLSVG